MKRSSHSTRSDMKDSSRMRSESKSDVDPTLSNSTMDSKLTSDEEKAKARREKYSKKFKETKKVAALSEEDRFNAMLGKGKGADPTLSMDQYCGCCGVEHKAPELLDNYYLCAACQNALREPRVLREAWADRPQACKLEICYATWGHPSLPVAYEVTKTVQARVDEIWYRDRLQYKRTENLNKMFGEGAGLPESKWDPCPGENKQLKVRYRLVGMHAQLQLDAMPNGQLTANFMLIAPRTRYLIINRATYGHPKGLSQQGRMSIDVTEIVQGIVDAGMSGGSYLTLSYMRPVKPIFGDPCPGYPKDLRINFEVCGRSGTLLNDEIRGHLVKRVHLEFSPTIKPLIFVLSGTYGITPTGRKTRMDEIRRLLKKIEAINHRKMNGVMPSREEQLLLFTQNELKADFEMLRDSEVGFIDIRDKLQRLADSAGSLLEFHKDRFDANAAFGNPQPGKPKLLEVSFESPGHDSERETDSQEMTGSGHPRNFITNKSGKYCIAVKDVPGQGYARTAAGRLRETLKFHTDQAAPTIHITRATYGVLDDPERVVDVTLEVQDMVEGKMLHIGTDVDLVSVFSKDPCPGMRKQLRINYVTRGFIGQTRVRELNDCFITNIELGYPPVPEADL
jgi:hypothetical protein